MFLFLKFNSFNSSLDRPGYYGVIDLLVPEYQNYYSEPIDHANTLTRRINLVILLTQIHELGAWNHMVQSSGIYTLFQNIDKGFERFKWDRAAQKLN